jgi:hypothetical protein
MMLCADFLLFLATSHHSGETCHAAATAITITAAGAAATYALINCVAKYYKRISHACRGIIAQQSSIAVSCDSTQAQY